MDQKTTAPQETEKATPSHTRRKYLKTVSLNLLFLPGSGSLSDGRWKTGLIQVAISLGGFGAMIAGLHAFSSGLIDLGFSGDPNELQKALAEDPSLAGAFSGSGMAGLNLMFCGILGFLFSWGWCLLEAFLRRPGRG